MNTPITIVWVVDDDITARDAAAQCIEQVAKSMDLKVEIRKIGNLTWPPAYDKYPEAPKEGEFPHLVLLDLVQQGTLFGDQFYKGLRNEENKQMRAFVIMWSGFLSRDSKAREFAATAVYDAESGIAGRVVNLKVGYNTPKSLDVLAEAVRGAFGRIQAEDLWAIEAESLRIPGNE